MNRTQPLPWLVDITDQTIVISNQVAAAVARLGVIALPFSAMRLPKAIRERPGMVPNNRRRREPKEGHV
jgi:hypothetical protein